MSDAPPTDSTEVRGLPLDAVGVRQTLALHTETVSVAKRVRKSLVRAATSTVERTVEVDEELAQESVVVERVAVGRIVDEVPPVRQEGNVTIVPVVEEELVMVRRLVLKEEVHFRRVRTTTRHTETVTLRQQKLTVTRTQLETDDDGRVTADKLQHQPKGPP